MCLLVLAWRVHPRYRLVVAANRDEFHERPTAAMSKWPAPNDILAGRDLRAQGTWLGLDRQRRFGVITNFRELQRPRANAPSRGELIPRFLATPVNPPGPSNVATGELGTADRFLAELAPRAADYTGFNLLLADTSGLWYASNRMEPFARALPPGVYGLSNEYLDSPWPKLQRVRRRFDGWLSDPNSASVEALFRLLDDRTPAASDAELPKTGIPLEWERVLSAPFVVNPDYGTRCSTVLLLEPSGALRLVERRFDSQGRPLGQSDYALDAGGWP